MLPILQLDRAGQPSAWINHRQAISMIASERVLANLGSNETTFKGGYNRFTGDRSIVSVGTILLTTERVIAHRLNKDYIVPYSNKILFERDDYTCQYCAERFPAYLLSRDHVIPKSRGGSDAWSNSATCCKICNQRKNDRTPEEWGHLLIAVPFAPTWSEFLFLKNRRKIINDQYEFLSELFPKDSSLKKVIN